MAMLPQLTWSVGVVGESVKSAIKDSSGMVSSSTVDVGTEAALREDFKVRAEVVDMVLVLDMISVLEIVLGVCC